MVELFGIKNCDKVKAAKKWLESSAVSYHFQDIREKKVTVQQWQQWLQFFGWETLLNKRSTTWKALDPNLKVSLNNKSARTLLENNPTLMKRPLILIHGQPKLLGFKESEYNDLF